MPSIPIEILDTTFYNNFLADTNHPFWQTLRENNNYDWAPIAPVRMYYCGGDQHVSPGNSIVAETHMISNGGIDVQAVEVDPNLDHGECAVSALFEAILWAEAMIDSCTETTILEQKNTELILYPNPTKGIVNFENNTSEKTELILLNSLGEKVF